MSLIKNFTAVIALTLAVGAKANDDSSDSKTIANKPPQQSSSPEPTQDKRLVLAPVVMSNPAFGDGGGVAAIYFLGDATQERRSRVISQVLYSNTDSYAAVLGSTLHLNEDQQRIKVFGVNARIRNAFDDINGETAEYDSDIYFFRAEALNRFGKNFYAGPLLSYKKAEYTATNEQAPEYFERVGISDNESVIIGAMLAYDTRDNDSFPYQGVYLASSVQISEQSLGGDENYQISETEFNHYHKLSNNHVIAVRHYGRFSFNAPYSGQAKLGQRNDLRGYTSGEIVNEHMFSNQLEYRWTTTGKWTYVGFVGAAAMYDGGMANIDDASWYKSIGLGLRYRLQDAQRINFRIDLAIGDDDNDGFYVSLKEAF
jgi:outer membrane protein assembly factor BamA